MSALASDEISAAEVLELAARFETAPLPSILKWAWERFGTRAALGTSFQGAGLVILNEASAAGLRFPVFTLDTQLLFPETYALKKRIEERFDIEIEGLTPDYSPELQEKEFGPELWKTKPDLCCQMRKVEPLARKFEHLAMWITGLRRQQSDRRQTTQVLELYKFDVWRDRYILKLNPMVTWTRDQVWSYVREHDLPYNPLHDQGFRSIGCWPCTRPVGAGENERAGRWTGFDKAECGIHTFLGESI